jgi:preprotein translocase subunit SecG
MIVILTAIHVFVCVALIMIVLLQTGKGSDMGAAFGGGSSQTLFGTTGASTFLSKATTVAAIIFMITSLGLAYLSGHQPMRSVIKEDKAPIEQSSTPGTTSLPAGPSSTQPARGGPSEKPPGTK